MYSNPGVDESGSAVYTTTYEAGGGGISFSLDAFDFGADFMYQADSDFRNGHYVWGMANVGLATIECMAESVIIDCAFQMLFYSIGVYASEAAFSWKLWRGGGVAVEQGAKGGKIIDNLIINNPRVGSALKIDGQHGFSNIIDNYAGEATRFNIPTKGPGGVVLRKSELFQLRGSLNDRSGIFEWILDNNQITHRRFIPGGNITGYPNQIVK